jgi:hypothetical protein
MMRWLRQFRATSTFPNPSVLRSGSKRLPTLLHNNPDLHKSFLQYAWANIKNLSTEVMHQYLIVTALPEIVKKIENTMRRDEKYNVQNLLEDNGLRKLSLSKVHNWMKCMGFSYEPHKKTYYVNNHKKPENVLYRSSFIDRYFEYELCAHRWLLVPEDRVMKMKENGEFYPIKKDTRSYKDQIFTMSST